MKYELSQKFYFEAAHTLNREIDSEGSRQIHGHTYHAEVTVSGSPDPITGMIIDIGLFRHEIERIRKTLDHRFLDDIADLGPATLENLCTFICKSLRDSLSNIVRVRIERPASGDSCTLVA
ncbi:6-pyruvoyl trahydropterin synthase family protein [Cupriavidus sp. 30B13]|uniref:6-pyruvoyl trahydropterin synthase family protein n=1 Tax=Cupriavidus sp. 30B13 TaxID=3384241 RepID=UPI003B9096C2